jgi:hypothetical protein
MERTHSSFEAATIDKLHSGKRCDANKKDLWLAKYRGVKVDGVLRIVTSVTFQNNQWFLVAHKAK